jgi:hypothetical protein
MADPADELTPSEIAAMFGGTFHAFDAWLLTRPDLATAGSACQLDAYAAYTRGDTPLPEGRGVVHYLDITREIVERAPNG